MRRDFGWGVGGTRRKLSVTSFSVCHKTEIERRHFQRQLIVLMRRTRGSWASTLRFRNGAEGSMSG